jgi:DNA invertase Pin-like site-specific DNA recombinase
LSYVAETERAFNRQRQKEGIAIAKEKGVRFGRAPKAKPKIFPDIYAKWVTKELSARAAARELGVNHRTFLMWASEHSATIIG